MKKRFGEFNKNELDEYCKSHVDCSRCPLNLYGGDYSYLCLKHVADKNPTHLSQRALDIEIEVPVVALSQDEKNYLIKQCLLFKELDCHILSIERYKIPWETNCYLIFNVNDFDDNYKLIDFPLMNINSLFGNMELEKHYKLKDLGIDNFDEYETMIMKKE